MVHSQSFTLKSKDEVVRIINDFIKICNFSFYSKNGFPLFSSESEKFPIFYRPNSLMYSYMKPSNSQISQELKNIISSNLNYISNRIKLNEGLKEGGSGLIISQGKVGKPLDLVRKDLIQVKVNERSITYGSVGAEKLFLLSHSSSIPGKGKINFDDTLYGISPEQYSTEILPKTSSVVRGEELIELLNLIVRYLISHTHAFPGLPPIEKTDEGVSYTEILEQLQSANNKILNKNIRIN